MVKVTFLLMILALQLMITEGCNDVIGYRKCRSWRKYCRDRRYYNYMYQNCKRTCTYCSSISVCSDTGSRRVSCPYWKSIGYCKSGSRYYDFMRKQCKKTCGFCKTAVVPTTLPTVTKRTTSTQKKTTKIASTTKSISLTTTDVPSTLGCGFDISEISFVIAGQNAPPRKWKWQIGLYYFGDFICGGSLITREHVLTAAHCVKYRFEDEMVVRLGDHKRDTKEGQEVEIEVESVKYHEEYDGSTLLNDIAILKLKERVNFTNSINVVCLPKENEAVETGKSCLITGWGRTEDGGESANTLQEAIIPIVSNEKCGERNKDNEGNSKIHPSMVCAGHESGSKISGCQGDSGGPLVCKSKERKWVLQGIVSWGSARCDNDHRYTVFTRTSKFISWINNNV